jgi:hypothetical protein
MQTAKAIFKTPSAKLGFTARRRLRFASAEDVLQLLKVAAKIFNKRSKQPTTGGLPG